MVRNVRNALIALAIATVGLSAGCAKKTTTVQMEERTVESEPQMVSPGQEVVE